ncbi:MAG: dienelactone hydrolase family protein [Pseudobdellovibrio sp.]
MKVITFVLTIMVSVFSLANELSAKTVEYGVQDKYEGYLVFSKKIKKNAPAIIMIPNWMGLTAETKKQAERFAKLGYVVFAADIYGKGLNPKNSNEAGVLATKYKADRKLFRDHLNLALIELRKQKNINTNKIAAVGYCFGGTGAIELARSGADITGVISFHGGLDSPAPNDGKNIKAKILALHGAIDPYVAATDVNAFEDEMKNNHVDYQLVKYSGTVHSFTEVGAGIDITKGAAYNEVSDRRSFLAAENFLSEIFNANLK